jgi:tetratricopeptide (TPR) repeat protein
MKRTVSILICGFLLTTSCTSFLAYRQAKSDFESGQYNRAVLILAGSLKQKPDQQKAIILLKEAFPLAVQSNHHCIQQTAGNSDFPQSRIADCYLMLHRINAAVEQLPPLYDKKAKMPVSFSIEYYHDELESAKEAAAEEQYRAGLALAGSDDIEDNKQAYTHFQNALGYVPGYKDAAMRAERSRDAATARIIVLPVIDSSQYAAGNVNIELIVHNALLTELSRGAGKKLYTRIIDRSNIDEIMAEQKLAVSDLVDNTTALKVGGLLGANHIVVTQVLQVDYTPLKTSVQTEQRSQLSMEIPAAWDAADTPVVVAEETPEIEYKAVFIYHEKNTKIAINASYKLISLETSELVTGDVVEIINADWSDWAEYEGDVQALSEQDLALIHAEPPVASADDLLTAATRDLGQLIARRILAELD